MQIQLQKVKEVVSLVFGLEFSVKDNRNKNHKGAKSQRKTLHLRVFAVSYKFLQFQFRQFCRDFRQQQSLSS